MIIWTWLVGRVGQLAASAIGFALVTVLITGTGALVVSWIKSANDASWLKEINQASAKATAQEKARAAASEKAAQAEREKAEKDAAAAVEHARSLEQQLQAMKDDPVVFPKALARSLNQ